MEHETKEKWVEIIRRYNYPDNRSWWQLLNTIIPYFILWYLMYLSLEVSYWLTLGLSILAGAFLVRIFIIFHDCGHGSYFKSKKLRDFFGYFTGLLLFTPYERWHYDHMVHHQTVGNLDKKGIGDVRTFTVEEYIEFSTLQRVLYKISRHPITLFIVGPLLLFVVIFRFPFTYHSRKIRWRNHLSTLLIVGMVAGMCLLIGYSNYILIQAPTLYFGALLGVWLFYVQHQYEDVIWERQENWDYKTIALKGSSYLKLPKVLQWFTGNIGFHHIHHLSPAIPNYKLEECYRENPEFQVEKPLTFISALKCMRYRLWDEHNRELIGFRELRERYGDKL